jgi:hypothetical protein
MAVDRDNNSDGYSMKFMICYWSERCMLRLVIAKYKLTANLYLVEYNMNTAVNIYVTITNHNIQCSDK